MAHIKLFKQEKLDMVLYVKKYKNIQSWPSNMRMYSLWCRQLLKNYITLFYLLVSVISLITFMSTHKAQVTSPSLAAEKMKVGVSICRSTDVPRKSLWKVSKDHSQEPKIGIVSFFYSVSIRFCLKATFTNRIAFHREKRTCWILAG